MHSVHDRLADYGTLLAKERQVLGVFFSPFPLTMLLLLCSNKAFLTSHSFINSGALLESSWVLYHHTDMYNRAIAKSHLPLFFTPQKFRQ